MNGEMEGIGKTHRSIYLPQGLAMGRSELNLLVALGIPLLVGVSFPRVRVNAKRSQRMSRGIWRIAQAALLLTAGAELHVTVNSCIWLNNLCDIHRADHVSLRELFRGQPFIIPYRMQVSRNRAVEQLRGLEGLAKSAWSTGARWPWRMINKASKFITQK